MPSTAQLCPPAAPGARQGWVKLPWGGSGDAEGTCGAEHSFPWPGTRRKEAAAALENPAQGWSLHFKASASIECYNSPVILSRATTLARGHQVQMQHKYSVRCSPALPSSGCCHCCAWKGNPFMRKHSPSPATHLHCQSPAQPFPQSSWKVSVQGGASWGFISAAARQHRLMGFYKMSFPKFPLLFCV